jgi:hypothetical protein
MVDTASLNATSSSFNVIASINPSLLGWMITIAVFIGILATVYLISRNFRQMVLGGIITGVLYCLYKLSRWIGVSASAENNYIPLSTAGWILGFIVVSIIVGRILMFIPFVKELIEDDKK